MSCKITREEYMQMYEIIGAAIDVYNELGRGLEEALYHESMEFELKLRGISYESEKILRTYYKEHLLNKIYQPIVL